MKKNVGSTDKTVRILFAVVVAVLAITKVITGPVAIIALVLGGIFVLTSVISFCPLYLPLKINTDNKKNKN